MRLLEVVSNVAVSVAMVDGIDGMGASTGTGTAAADHCCHGGHLELEHCVVHEEPHVNHSTAQQLISDDGLALACGSHGVVGVRLQEEIIGHDSKMCVTA